MTSAPTTATSKKCERCLTAEVPHLTVLGVDVELRYCAPCADKLHDELEAAEEMRATELRLQRAGMTNRLAKFTWGEASRPEVARKWLAGYRAGERRNLILEGAVGAGKTGLAWLTIAALCEHKIPALFVNLRDLLWEIRQDFNRDSDGGSLLIARAQTVPVLALDDLGAERPTAWAREELSTLVDKRYEGQLPTIVTSNYSLAELASRIGHDDPVVGQRIVSRLTEDAMHVRFNGTDRRLAA